MTTGTGHRRWDGHWIWSGPNATIETWPPSMVPRLDESGFDRRVLFRREFDLDALPERASIRLTADSRYILAVNGEEVGRGPIRHGAFRLHYDEIDLLPHLVVGRNAIAIQVRFYGWPNAWWRPLRTAYPLGGGALVAEIHLDDEVIPTDERWSATVARAWAAMPPDKFVTARAPEMLDARLLPLGWDAPGFDESGWSPADVLVPIGKGTPRDSRPPSDPVGPLVPNPLRAPVLGWERAHRVRRAAVPSGPAAATIAGSLQEAFEQAGAVEDVPASGPVQVSAGRSLITVDFDRIVHGHVQFEADLPRGAVVHGAVVERASLGRAPVFRYTARGDRDRYISEDPMAGRFLVLLVDTPAPGTIAPALRSSMRPRPEGAYFRSSDPEIDRIYEVGVRSVDLTATDAYLDCPTRESRTFTGDSVVHQSVDLAVNPDWSLALASPELLDQPREDGQLPLAASCDVTDSPTVIPDWPLHWIHSVHNVFRYSGDADQVRERMMSAESVLRWFDRFRGDDGLLTEVPSWVLIDWSPVQVSGTSAALNALWARGLAEFAEMAEWLGDSGRARWARSRHDDIAAAFDVFWDAEASVYRDHIVDGVLHPAVSEHTAAAAVCAGIVPAERHAEMRRFLLDREAMASSAKDMEDRVEDDPHHEFDLFARIAAGEGEPPVLDLDRWLHVLPVDGPEDPPGPVTAAQPFFRYVVHDALAALGAADALTVLYRDWSAMLPASPGSWREGWEGGSYCHGWSSTPTRDLVVYTAGITPAAPGFAAARIDPRLGGLSWLEVGAPTPRGILHLRVDEETLSVDAPLPVEVVSADGAVTRLPPGRHALPRSRAAASHPDVAVPRR